jgi:hypothetical protein
MTHTAALPGLGSEFDTFLHAPVGGDKHGMVLSVLSALARLNVDPWQEAANLAELPQGTAIERLASFISALPNESVAHSDPESIATRLIALLPSRTGSTPQSPFKAIGIGGVANAQTVVRIVAFNLVLVAFMLGAQWMATSHLSPTQAAATPAAASQANPPPPLTPNPGQ